jgi:hypothetical protein
MSVILFEFRNNEDTLVPQLDLYTKWVITSVRIVHKVVRCTQLAPNQREKRELEIIRREEKKVDNADVEHR